MMGVDLLKRALKLFFLDQVNLILGLIPLGLGLILYGLCARWIYGSVLPLAHDYLKASLTRASLSEILYYLMMGIFTAFLIFLINYTFIVVVAIISAPFSDLMSSRVERRLRGEPVKTLEQENLKAKFWGSLRIVRVEIKKLLFILLLVLMSLFLGLIPFLTPLTFLISALLVSIQFLDYSWSRHSWTFRACLKDLGKNIIPYSLYGALFGFLIAVPLVNLFVIPVATCLFTILWTEKHIPRSSP